MSLSERFGEISDRVREFVENVVILESVDSTHSVALRLMDQMDAEELSLRPTLVLSERQLGGLGRGRHRWISPRGGLYLSWMSADVSGDLVPRMPMLAAVAAHRSVTAVGVTGAVIKWPNDILVDDRKLAGILIHARGVETPWVTVGLGVNLVPVGEAVEDPIHPPTSMAEAGVSDAADALAIATTVEFLGSLTASIADPDDAIRRWRDTLDHSIGDSISVRVSSGQVRSGTFAGLTDEGFLRLEQAGTEVVITGGDVVES
jgi:BirA family biotin operon repressor/biotin-[acetyl-CoA-carboxylase] ligase